MTFGHTDRGSWRLSAELPPDEGAVVEKALTAMRDELFGPGEAGTGPGAAPADVSWADAFVAMAEVSFAADAVKHPHRDRSMVLLHVDAGKGGHLHLGPGLSEGLRRYIGCDSRVRAIFEAAGKPVSVGRPRPATGQLRPAHATWERRAASLQLGAAQRRAARSVGHLPERARPAESRVRRVMFMAGAWETMLRNQTEHSRHPLSRHRLLVAHLDYAWHRARPAMDGLTDDEFYWEPVPNSWTVRRLADGLFMPDWASPEPSPAPFTTIGWRATHIGFVLHMRANHRFGDGSLTAMNAPWPGSAKAALSWMDGGFDAYRAGVEGLVDGELDVPPEGPPGYIDTRFPLAMTVQHVTLELIHHGAEICLLRELYRCAGAGSMATASGNESASNVGE